MTTTPSERSAIVLPLQHGQHWAIAMRRAHAIRRYKGTAKNYAVRLWRVSVQTALAQEVAR